MTEHLKTFLKANRGTLFLLVACLTALGIMAVMTLGKDLRTRKRLQKQLSEASHQAEINEMLAPLVAEFHSADKTMIPGDAEGTDIRHLLDSDAENYQDVIEQMIRLCHLGPATVTPDIHSILSDTDHIQVALTTRGAFSDFRRLIIQLGRLPYMEGVDRYYIRQTSDAAGLEMALRLRIKKSSPAEIANDDE